MEFRFNPNYARNLLDAMEVGDAIAAPATWDELLTLAAASVYRAMIIGGPDDDLSDRVMQHNDEQAEAIVDGAAKGVLSAVVYEVGIIADMGDSIDDVCCRMRGDQETTIPAFRIEKIN